MTVYLSALAGAGAQFFTDDGEILSGGKIYTYAAGTTTPALTYTSSAGDSQNPNPIVLDSAGRTPEDVWLIEGTTYKFVLTDSNDVQIGEYDDIPGINDFASGEVPWSSITGEPTTVAGYGITDALTTTAAATTYAPKASPTFTGVARIPDNATVSTNYAVGYRDAPQVLKTDNYTLTASDAGKSIVMNGATKTLTIPASTAVTFEVGAVIVIVNINATALTIDITTDTLTLANTTTTGSRTLARNGIATCIKIQPTSWIISGNGLS